MHGCAVSPRSPASFSSFSSHFREPVSSPSPGRGGGGSAGSGGSRSRRRASFGSARSAPPAGSPQRPPGLRDAARPTGRDHPLGVGARPPAQGHRTNTSAFGVYEIWLHDGEAPRTTPDATALEAEADPPVARRTLAVDKVHGPLAAARAEVYDHEHAPTWFLTRIPPGRSAATDLDPAGAAQGTDQTLTAHVWATRIGAVAIKARWGERGSRRRLDRPPQAERTSVAVPADAVPAEGTALVLEDVSPKPPAPESQDISDHRGTLWVDALSLEGEVEPTIGGRLRRFTLVDGEAIELRSAAAATADSVHVAAVGRPAVSGWRWGHVADGRIRVKTLDLPPGSQVFVSTHARDVEPEPPASGRTHWPWRPG